MAIQVNGTTVIDNSRNLSNVGGLKTVGGTSILGSGDIATGGSTAVNGVGTYILGFDVSMSTASNSTGSIYYKTGRTTAGSNIQAYGTLMTNGGAVNNSKLTAMATSTSGTYSDTYYPWSTNTGSYSSSIATDNQTFSGTWRQMGPASNGGGNAQSVSYNWRSRIGCIFVRIS